MSQNADYPLKGHTVCLCSNSSKVFLGSLIPFISEVALTRKSKIDSQNDIFKTSK